MPRPATHKQKEDALRRFDEAAQEYAFRGTHSGSGRYDEVCQEYWAARASLMQLIGV